MKKLVAILIAAMMVFSVMAIFASAEGETVTLYIGDEVTEAEVRGSSVDVEQTDDGIAATTTGSDPWVSIELPDVDTSIYKFFTVTYRCDKEVGSNNTYMKITNYIGNADGGDWEPHGMGGTADGQWHTKEYSMDGFPTFADEEITGIRLTCCGEEGGVFEVKSVRFTKEHYDGETGTTTPETPAAPYTYVNASFDTLDVDGVINFGIVLEEGHPANGDGWASDKLDMKGRTVDGSDGSVKLITMRGWIGFNEVIEAFGYQMDGNAPVLSADNIATTEDAVKGAGGQNALRFSIPINVEGLEGTHKFVVVVKLAGVDEPIKIDESFGATGPATAPNTSFTFVGRGSSSQPEQPTETSDMTMVLFIVAAAAVALVILKKRAF